MPAYSKSPSVRVKRPSAISDHDFVVNETDLCFRDTEGKEDRSSSRQKPREQASTGWPRRTLAMLALPIAYPCSYPILRTKPEHNRHLCCGLAENKCSVLQSERACFEFAAVALGGRGLVER